MIIYLTASWSRRGEMLKVRDELQKIPGLVVNSRWLDLEPATSASDLRFLPTIKKNEKIRRERQRRAIMDRDDVYAADIIVRFTDDLSAKMVPAELATGSRMVEMGMALRGQQPVIVVGGTQPIFDYLPEVQHVKTVTALKRELRRIVKGEKIAHRKSAATLKRGSSEDEGIRDNAVHRGFSEDKVNAIHHTNGSTNDC